MAVVGLANHSDRWTPTDSVIHTNYSIASNGTLVSHAGQVRHIVRASRLLCPPPPQHSRVGLTTPFPTQGQIFFPEDMNDEVFSQEPYNDSHHRRTTNEEDGIFRRGAGRGGYDAFADIEYVDGDDIGRGLIGYISEFGKVLYLMESS